MQEAERVDQDMPLAACDLFARVVTLRILRPPFCAALALWLSSTAARAPEVAPRKKPPEIDDHQRKCGAAAEAYHCEQSLRTFARSRGRASPGRGTPH